MIFFPPLFVLFLFFCFLFCFVFVCLFVVFCLFVLFSCFFFVVCFFIYEIFKQNDKLIKMGNNHDLNKLNRFTCFCSCQNGDFFWNSYDKIQFVLLIQPFKLPYKTSLGIIQCKMFIFTVPKEFNKYKKDWISSNRRKTRKGKVSFLIFKLPLAKSCFSIKIENLVIEKQIQKSVSTTMSFSSRHDYNAATRDRDGSKESEFICRKCLASRA